MPSISQADLVNFDRAVKELRDFDRDEWTDFIQALDPDDKTIRKMVADTYKVARGRLVDLANLLNTRFTAKSEIINLMFICAIAQEPMLLFGDPGTGKTELVREFAEGLGIRRDGGNSANGRRKLYFEYILNEFTEPDEIVGPVNIQVLTGPNPQFTRVRDGTITDAYIVFFDEIMRANSPILNILLPIINERQFYEGGMAINAKTLMIFGAANTPPVSPNLRAFYARFPIRVVSHLVLKEQRLDLLQKGWTKEINKQNRRYNPQEVQQGIGQRACLNDLLLCNRALMMLNPETLDETQPFYRLYNECTHALNLDKRQFCYIDDRKYIKLFKIIHAKVLYEAHNPEHSGSLMPRLEDLQILQHTWDDIDIQEQFAHVLQTFISDQHRGATGSHHAVGQGEQPPSFVEIRRRNKQQ